MVCIPLPGGIGILRIPNQYHQNALQQGIDYNLLVIGPSGLGKSTFINSILGLNSFTSLASCKSTELGNGKVKIQERHANLIESGFCTSVCVAEAVGFGDCVDNSDCWKPIVEYIKARNEEHWSQFTLSNRRNRWFSNDAQEPRPRDGRIHAALYFISPHGTGLKPLDVQAMKAIGAICNLIPIVAKADLLSEPELARFKGHVKESVREAGICTFDVLCGLVSASGERGGSYGDLDEEWSLRTAQVFAAFPLAVVGAGKMEKNSNSNVSNNATSNHSNIEAIVREMPWGTVQAENEEHCDFKKARSLLFRVNMFDLIESTVRVHYERFRSGKLLEVAGGAKEITALPPVIAASKPSPNVKRNQEEAVKREIEAFAAREEARIQEKERAIRELKGRLEREIEVEHLAVSQLKEKLVGYQKKSQPVPLHHHKEEEMIGGGKVK